MLEYLPSIFKVPSPRTAKETTYEVAINNKNFLESVSSLPISYVFNSPSNIVENSPIEKMKYRNTLCQKSK